MTRTKSRALSLGFLCFLGLIGLGAFWVFERAETAVLESQAGEVSTISTDPTDPGFRAFTTSSQTALVLHTVVRAGSGAELVGVTLLAAADDAAGGTVLTIPPTLVNPESTALTLRSLFAADGLTAVVGEVSETLGIGFGDVVVLDASAWTSLMVADLPLTLTLRDDLVANNGVASLDPAADLVLEAGTRSFSLSEVATIAGHVNAGEPSLGIALRHQQIWRAWISRTAGSDERPELFAQDSGFATVIGALANDEVSYRVVDSATVSAEDSAETVYEAQVEPIADLISQIVPFPEPAAPGDRPTVTVLDTEFGVTNPLPTATAITRSGGLVTILGNPGADDDLGLEVQVHDPSAGAVAQEIADRLGYSPPRSVLIEDAPTAITVTIG